MSGFPGSPRLSKAGLVLVDPQSAVVKRVITLQYNPDTINRTLQVQGVGGDGDRSEALRLKGPPIETIKLEADIDATDQVDAPQKDRNLNTEGLHPQLAALEAIVYPTSAELIAGNAAASRGEIEILPLETDLTLFVWSKQRIVPVRITELSITEEAFDPALNPIRAKVSLGLRVLSVTDLGFAHKGGGLFLSYLRAKEQLSDKYAGGALSSLGIGAIS
jgi:hypothetical protein